MERSTLGSSGFRVPVLSYRIGSFARVGEFFRACGQTDVEEATLYPCWHQAGFKERIPFPV